MAATPPFERFLDDDAEYDACETYWRDLTRAAVLAQGGRGVLVEWMARQVSKERDGNPLLAAKLDDRHRGVRIIQVRSRPGASRQVSAWIDFYGPEYSDELPREQLTVHLEPSLPAYDAARRLIEAWASPATGVDEMERLIEQLD